MRVRRQTATYDGPENLVDAHHAPHSPIDFPEVARTQGNRESQDDDVFSSAPSDLNGHPATINSRTTEAEKYSVLSATAPEFYASTSVTASWRDSDREQIETATTMNDADANNQPAADSGKHYEEPRTPPTAHHEVGRREGNNQDAYVGYYFLPSASFQPQMEVVPYWATACFWYPPFGDDASYVSNDLPYNNRAYPVRAFFKRSKNWRKTDRKISSKTEPNVENAW